MSISRPEGVQASYDAVAEEYARRLFHELDQKPLDRELLDRVAAATRGQGIVADIGCGPGHVARYLSELGAEVVGVDLSSAMVDRASRLSPGIDFVQGDMRALPAEAGAWAGIVAFYSLIHIPRESVTDTLREFARVLRPGGHLLLSFHCGEEVLHLDELWDHDVSLDFVLFLPEEMRRYVTAANFAIEDVIVREPYPPDVEHQSRRCYVLARAPEGRSAAAPRQSGAAKR